MAGKTLKTTISIGGDVDASVQKAISAVADKIEKMQEAALKSSTATERLSATIDLQRDELDKAKKAYMEYVLNGEKSSKAAKALAKHIKKLSSELDDNEGELKDAEDAAEKLSGGLKKTGDAAKDTEGGFTIMKGAIANLLASGIKSLISMTVDAAKGLYGLAESTREYRETMGKLETAWESAGKSTELATETYKNFYSVLGEEDRSVEAVNHLAKFVETEQDMQKWTDICTGVWGTFGDSLPVEGLTEAANETAKVGQLTGGLADALNWAGVNEEAFQESLDKCNSEQERAQLITETLTGLYGEAAEKYRENNESIIAARKANSEYTDTVARFGEIMEPITTKVQEGFTKILEKVLDLVTNGDPTAFGEKVETAFDGFINNVLPKIVNAIDWIGNNTGLIKGIAIAIGVVSAALGVLNVVLAVQSAIMMANPVTWIVLAIVAAIAALIAIIVLCVKHWDSIKAAAMSAVQWIVNGWNSVVSWFRNAVQSIGSFFSNLWSGISTGASNLVNGIKEFFSSGFQALVGIVKAPINAVISIINGAISGINSIGFDIPDWVPVIGGKKFAINIPQIPLLAKGGFTDGPSIAGEAGVEAVISFNPAYREENLSYWAQAGRLLGADYTDYLSADSSSGDYYDLSGVTFAPNITIQGNADKKSIMEAIEEEYPEFVDFLDEYLRSRRAPAYG